jgi:hypothetical protein
MTRQMPFEPLPASVLFALWCPMMSLMPQSDEHVQETQQDARDDKIWRQVLRSQRDHRNSRPNGENQQGVPPKHRTQKDDNSWPRRLDCKDFGIQTGAVTPLSQGCSADNGKRQAEPSRHPVVSNIPAEQLEECVAASNDPCQKGNCNSRPYLPHGTRADAIIRESSCGGITGFPTRQSCRVVECPDGKDPVQINSVSNKAEADNNGYADRR